MEAFVEAAGAAALRPLTQREFASFQTLIQREAGIFLSEVKKALLVGRLTKRLRELGLTSFTAYRQLVEEDLDERTRLLDAICTNETHFFREPRQLEFLSDQILAAWRAAADRGERPRSVRIWSAACSTGEEPYSLAMLLLDALAGWDVDILATDLSTRVLEKARMALFPIARSAEIPERYLKRFMLRGVGSQEGRMKAGPQIRSVVRFQGLNLNDETYPVHGAFDAVLCRNVLIYFQPETKARVLDRLVRHVQPGGYLLLGHAESAMGVSVRLKSVGPNAYVREGGRT
jgi:chemotaxis protein methyltransferase CheR